MSRLLPPQGLHPIMTSLSGGAVSLSRASSTLQSDLRDADTCLKWTQPWKTPHGLSLSTAGPVCCTSPVCSASLSPSRPIYLESNVIPNQSTPTPLGSTFHHLWDKVPRRVREHPREDTPGASFFPPPLPFRSRLTAQWFGVNILTALPMWHWQMTQLCFLSDGGPHPSDRDLFCLNYVNTKVHLNFQKISPVLL